MRHYVMLVKRMIRPLIPNALMAWVRLARQSSRFRVNYDIVAGGRRAARRWLSTTPDTCRVVRSDLPLTLDSVLRLTGADIAVAGRVKTPRLERRLRVEPVIEATEVLAAAGVELHATNPPVALDEARQRGLRIAVLPTEVAHDVHGHRTDRIDIPVAIVLSAVPMHDVGGGGRGAQLALELLKSGFHVMFVNVYEPRESTDLGIRFVHDHLEQVPLADFDARLMVERAGEGPHLCLLELPHHDLLAPAGVLSEAGFHVVYDLIDDWSDPALGGEWYEPTTEREVVELAWSLVASAPDLQARFPGAVLVPNGVNSDVFGTSDPGQPPDFPAGSGPVIGYHGSLYGDWFDWAELRSVAETHADARVVVIGDDRGHPPMPANIHFLGLKPQDDLPAYIQRFDVGIIPFVVNDTTHAVSPLKAYEYLACGVPVVAPPLRALEGLDGAILGDDLAVGVQLGMASPRPAPELMLARHSWEQRLATLLDHAGIDRPGSHLPARRLRRTPIHYERSQRRLG